MLLSPLDPPPFTLHRAVRRWPAVLVCDHASNAVPARLGQLGLTDDQLSQHIAWDIGAARLAEHLSQRLHLPLVSSGYSRLVVDCNRDPHSEASMLAVSDGHAIPGNAGLSAADRDARIRAIFEPYHAAIVAELAATACEAPALIAIHSFTPAMRGQARPWHCGILWDRDGRLPLPMLDALHAEPGLVVGDNEPYSGRDPSDYTVGVHGEAHGRPHVCIEVRQDLLQSASGVLEWGERFARVLTPLLDNPSLYRAMR